MTLTAPPALLATGPVDLATAEVAGDARRPRVPSVVAPRLAAARAAARPQRVGRVSSAVGLGLTVRGLDAAVGEIVSVGDGRTDASNLAEVVATTPDGVRCMPLGRLTGITTGTPVRSTGRPLLVPTGTGLFGRVLDGLGISSRRLASRDEVVPGLLALLEEHRRARR